MIKFSKRQMNTLLDGLSRLYQADVTFCNHRSTDNRMNYEESQTYMEGVKDALNIIVQRDTCGYVERYHVYLMESMKAAYNDSGNLIEIMTIDAFERKVIYDLLKDDSDYGKKYSAQVKEGLIKYYKTMYDEDIDL